jgi:polyferredoxin
MNASPWPLVTLRIGVVAFFLLAIGAGLWGTPIPERNLATTLTWTLWWTLVVISVFFIGTAWCAVCPWDTLAGWLVRRRLWTRGSPDDSLELKPPRLLRTVWPALIMFIGLTWLELGVGVTTSPLATASLALIMVVLATAALALFERKAFCRYACPVGRTLGFYAQLAPVALRPMDPERCARCETLECHHGTDRIPPCPTHLTMGRFAQNTYCLSCGSCVLACPADNISWRLRPMAAEAASGARPHWDEAWFMVALLALTTFHGVTMLPAWETGIRGLGRLLGDSGQLLPTFTLGMLGMLGITALLYGMAVAGMRAQMPNPPVFRRMFAALSFPTLPVAFAYHMAHNLKHLARESVGLGDVWANPLGIGTHPLTAQEHHMRMLTPLIPEEMVHLLQAGLMIWGFWLGVHILRHRTRQIPIGIPHDETTIAIPAHAQWPMVLFLAAVTGFNLWILTQGMMMRL